MKNIEKLIVAGLTFASVFVGHEAKVYVDSLGKYNCIMNKQTQVANSYDMDTFPTSSQVDQTTVTLIVSGRCDYDFNGLEDEE